MKLHSESRLGDHQAVRRVAGVMEGERGERGRGERGAGVESRLTTNSGQSATAVVQIILFFVI
jgi:hypothetical protein